MFKLTANNFLRGAVNAVVAAVVLAVAGTFSQGVDVFSVDWHAVFNLAVNSGVAAFVGYIGTKFMSDKEGKVFGKIG